MVHRVSIFCEYHIFKTPRRFYILMSRTTPTDPIEPTEPASLPSSPIKGRHAPGLTLYALGIEGFISPASLSLFSRPFGSGSHFHFPFLALYGKI